MALCPFAIHKLIEPGENDPAITPVGVVLHVAVSGSDTLHDYFDGPSGGIESHFYIRYDGTIEQYRDTEYEADANYHGNSFDRNGETVGMVSVETAGFEFGEWTAHQLAAEKRLLLWLNESHDIPLRKIGAWNGNGVGYHVQFGAPGQWTPVAKSCPGPNRIEQFENVLVPWMANLGEETEVPDEITLDLSGISPAPASIELDGNILRLRMSEAPKEQPPKDEPPKYEPPKEEPKPLPKRPRADQWDNGKHNAAFTKLGERFKRWLGDQISHNGNGYRPGPIYSEYDDFNTRKVQALMGNPVDPVGKAYLGPLQWARIFREGPPKGKSLPRNLRGVVPPQLRETKPKPRRVPKLPAPSAFKPGESHKSFTAMGERFKKWLKADEIHYAGSGYTPGPRYSKYDDRNVRAIQALMGNTPDTAGKEFLGAKQWERLFKESRPAKARVPKSLRPGGGGGGGSSPPAGNIPTDGRRVTLGYGVKRSRYQAGEHTGVDFGDSGSDAIRCVRDGRVVSRGYSGAWGNRVIVKHSNGRYSWYCHMRSYKVSYGESVKRGEVVGYMGSTGNVTGKHLHYQETKGGTSYWDYVRPIML